MRSSQSIRRRYPHQHWFISPISEVPKPIQVMESQWIPAATPTSRGIQCRLISQLPRTPFNGLTAVVMPTLSLRNWTPQGLFSRIPVISAAPTQRVGTALQSTKMIRRGPTSPARRVLHDFPLSNPAQGTYGGNCDAFAAKVGVLEGIAINPTGLVFAPQTWARRVSLRL